MMRRWVCWVVRHPWLVIGLVLLATAVFAARVGELRSEVRVRDLLPQHHPYVKIHSKVEREFGGRSLVLLAVVPRQGDVWQPAVLAKVKALTDEVLKLPGVIPQNVTSLSAPAVRAFSDSGGRIEVQYLMREAPTTTEEITRLRLRVEDVTLYRGLLVSGDGRAGLVMADFWPERDEHEIARVIERVARRHADEAVDVYWAGTPIVLDAITKEVVRTQRRFLISFVGIAAILYLAFGSFQGVVVPLATAGFAVLWGVGLMAWLGVAIDGWTVMTPVLILAVAAGHSAQMLKRYYEEYERLGDNHEAVIESTSRIGLVMLAAGTTASLGILSLLVFRVPSLRNFAIFTSWGIAAAMILQLSFIPACRSLLRAPADRSFRNRRRNLFDRALERTAGWTGQRAAARVLVTWAILSVVGLVGILRVHATASFETFIPPSSPVRRNVDAMKRYFRGAVPMVIEIEGEEGAIQAPEVLRYIAELGAYLRNHPSVERVLSVADLLGYVNRVLGPDGRETLPQEPDLVSQLLFLTYSAPYERFLDRAYRKAAIWAYLRSDDTASIDRAIRHAKEWVEATPPPKGVDVLVAGGMGPATVAINEETTQGKVWNVALIYLVIFLVGSLLFRSPVAGALIVLPLLVSFVLSLGILGWGRINLDLTTATILAIGTGIGADYAIYLLSRINEEVRSGRAWEESLRTALLTSGKAVWFVAFAVGGGYLLLSPFSFLPLRLFGILIPAIMLLACSSAVTLIPAILSLARPRFFRCEEAAATPRARAVGE